MADLVSVPNPATECALRLEHVNYWYPQVQDSFAGSSSAPESRESDPILSDISLDIRAGECLLLTGASGSGKSTLLRALNGLVPQFYEGNLEGRITVFGRDIEEIPLGQMAHDSAMVFQNPRTQFFTPAVLDELALTLENWGVEPQEIATRIARASTTTGIEPFVGRQITQLSGGQLQRVACACASVTGAPILLLDEPTSNLSTGAIADFAALLARLKAAGVTIIIAEHRLHFMRSLADRVVRLEHGRITGVYSAQEFFSLSEDTRRVLGLRAFEDPQVQLPAPGRFDAHGVPVPGVLIENLHFSYSPTKRSWWSRFKGATGSPSALNNSVQSAIFTGDSFFFPAGAVTVLTGENGTGKSTLAQIIAGLLHPHAGTISEINGGGETRVLSAAERVRATGMVMQDARRSLFSESVAAEITLGLTPEQKQGVNVHQILEDMDLLGVSDHHPAAISGGQAQRLAIACTLASDKKIVIFDEPTSGVDAAHMSSIAALMRSVAERGAVVICITHDNELKALCDMDVSLGGGA